MRPTWKLVLGGALVGVASFLLLAAPVVPADTERVAHRVAQRLEDDSRRKNRGAGGRHAAARASSAGWPQSSWS